MKLSILDQVPVSTGQTAAESLANTKDLALLGDELGYHRMWWAEHHGGKTFASSAPEIITAHLAGLTKNIRLGTGGTMLMHYSPLKLAEVFKTLSAFAPGRIDFGIGRAPGGDMNATRALASGRGYQPEDLYQKFQVALDLMRDVEPEVPVYQKTLASPTNVTLPEAWLLGSSGNSAVTAGKMGVGYSFAQFFVGAMSEEIFASYRHFFEPSYYMAKPEISVAYLTTVAETPEEAEFLAGTADIHRLSLIKNQPLDFITPAEAQERKLQLTEMDKMRIQDDRQTRHLVGTSQEVAEKIKNDGIHYGFDEAIIVSLTRSHEKKRQVYQLLAKEFLG